MSATAKLSDAALLERLVAFDTTSRLSNLPLVDFVSEYLDRRDVDAWTRLRLARRHQGQPRGPHRPRIAEDGSGLTLSGHMDVVPAEEPDWRSDPFNLTRSGTPGWAEAPPT